MTPFDVQAFAQVLLADLVFYDEEYGVLGVVSLVDPDAGEERYVCSFDPEDGTFAIEQGTVWENEVDEKDVGFALATELDEYGRYETPEEAALVLLSLARDEDLLPSVSLHFEADESG